MGRSVFRKAALEAKSKGDTAQRQPVGILRLPTKLLTGVTLATAIGGIYWSFVADIPINYPGTAACGSLRNIHPGKARGPAGPRRPLRQRPRCRPQPGSRACPAPPRRQSLRLTKQQRL